MSRLIRTIRALTSEPSNLAVGVTLVTLLCILAPVAALAFIAYGWQPLALAALYILWGGGVAWALSNLIH